MTNLAMMLFDIDPMPGGFGLWMFLSIGAVALFVVFIPVTTWIDSQRKEREAFYKAETVRRLTESSGEGAKAAIELNSSVRMVATTVMNTLFQRYRPKLNLPNRSV